MLQMYLSIEHISRVSDVAHGPFVVTLPNICFRDKDGNNW